MAKEYRDIQAYEGTLVQCEATAFQRKRFYASDGRGGIDDTGIYGYYDNNYNDGAPNPSVSRHFFLTLDNDLNPMHAIGEDGIFFRHSSLSPITSDVDLLLVDNDEGTRVNWPKLWWDYSETSFIFTKALRTNLSLISDYRIGVGTLTPVSLLELKDTDANPVLTITAAFDATYDPQIQFKTGNSPLVVCGIGVDATDDSLRFHMGTGNIGGSTDFVMKGDGKIALGISNPDCLFHLHLDGAGTVSALSNTILALENSNHAYLSILTPDSAIGGILFGCPASNQQGALFFNHHAATANFEMNIYSTTIFHLSSVGLSLFKSTTAASAWLEVYGTTEQFRLSYDADCYASFTIDNSGSLTINPRGINCCGAIDRNITLDAASTLLKGDINLLTYNAVFIPNIISQAAEPTPASNELVLWKDTDDDNKIYLVYNSSGSVKKVQLT